MDIEKAKLLSATLRSGEFKQGQNALRFEDTYCCLGVACELYRRETGKGHWDTSGTYPSFRDDTGHMSSSELTPAVKEWLGFKTLAGLVENVSLIALNDERRLDFPAIADFIDANVEEL